MDFNSPTILGRTGLPVGRLGVAAAYGAPAEAFELAFERGANYFYWGATRRGGMARAIRNLTKSGKRDELVVAVQSFSRWPWWVERSLRKGLKNLGLEYADVLLLGWYNTRVPERLLDRADRLKRLGLIRHLGVSGHNRPMFARLAADERFGLFHLRYNAAHRGAETEVFPLLGPKPEARPGIVSFTATRWGQLLQEKRMPQGQAPLTASDCYRFALTPDAVDVALTGPRTMAQMEEALKTLGLGPMNMQELARARLVGDHVRANSRRG